MLAGTVRIAHKAVMAAAAPGLREVIDDGRWLAHRYDDSNDSIQFRFVPREAQRGLTFLTDAEIGEVPLAVFGRGEAMATARELDVATPRLIFHSAYCCSTMLVRAFDVPGTSFGLSEPQILNDVIGLRLRGGDGRQVAAALDAALVLLGRPLGSGEINVIKPSNLVNPLLPLFAALRPGLRSLALYAPLETFLGSIARKEIEGRLWVRELMWKFIRLGQAHRFGLTDEDLYRQSDLQAAALGWLVQHALFADTVDANDRLRTLDSERMLAESVPMMRALGDAFELGLDAEAIVAGSAFTTHSKDGRAFSVEQRRQEQEERMSRGTREIAITAEWARELAAHAGVPWALPAALLD